MYILSAGAAFPEHILGNADIAGGDYSAPCVAAGHGLAERRTVLPLDYIRDEGNTDPMSLEHGRAVLPTTLGALAVQSALSNAGLTKEQLGLFLGDCSTPSQTTPSEAQRIAGSLGLKVNAYDLLASGAALVLHLDVISGWSSDRIPEYLVSVSTNTPTRAIDFRAGRECFIFGDGAGALVLSPVHKGRLKLIATDFVSESREISLFDVPFARHISMDPAYPVRVGERVKTYFERALVRTGVDRRKVTLITGCTQREILDEVRRDLQLSEAQLWSTGAATGDILGTTPYVVLSEHWGEIKEGSCIIVAVAGTGMTGGYAVMEGVA